MGAPMGGTLPTNMSAPMNTPMNNMNINMNNTLPSFTGPMPSIGQQPSFGGLSMSSTVQHPMGGTTSFGPPAFAPPLMSAMQPMNGNTAFGKF